MNDIQEYKTEFIDINGLKANPKNPRNIKNDDFERLKRQITRLGQYKPIIIDTRTGYIIGGHMRWEALKNLGISNVLVSYITSQNDAEALEYALSDNDRAGYYDEDLLANLTGEIPDIQWDDFSIDTKEPLSLDKIVENLSKDKEPSKFQVIVDCDTRDKQKEVYEKLFDMGYDVKTLTK